MAIEAAQRLDGGEPTTVEHLLKPPDPEVANLRLAMDQIGVGLSFTGEPPRRGLPEVATELIRVLQSPKADAAAIDTVISKDPFISAQVLSIANSALYAPRTPVLSVRDAAVRLGMDAVRDIALMIVTTSRMFRINGMERQSQALCQRAVVTAVASRRIAQLLGANTDYAFLVGLLHDVGHLLILEAAATAGLLSKRVLTSPDLLAVVLERSGHHHQAVGAVACRAWRLPEAVAQAAMYHHRYRHEAKHYVAANIVAAADLVADALGVGRAVQPLDPEAMVMRDIGLKPPLVPALVDETRAISAALGVPV